MSGGSVVLRYLHAVAACDWDMAEQCLAGDVMRIGPFGDTYQGRETYLDFLRPLMPSLAGYRMEIHRVIEASGPVVVELTETVSIDGVPIVTAESLTFDLDADDLIVKISIYIQQKPPATD